jgi:hypothetical protein
VRPGKSLGRNTWTLRKPLLWHFANDSLVFDASLICSVKVVGSFLKILPKDPSLSITEFVCLAFIPWDTRFCSSSFGWKRNTQQLIPEMHWRDSKECSSRNLLSPSFRFLYFDPYFNGKPCDYKERRSLPSMLREVCLLFSFFWILTTLRFYSYY